ncbi:MAG: DUF4147 domain-containing protein, partial [Planctomycetes bacterium]|nr:DUF4147 domain-containing protein [Planctomycetota bacterium]
TVRRWCSAVKGGRLALAAANAASQCTLAISDVRDGDWRALASGPTVADDTAIADCRAVLDRFALWPALPAALRTRIERTEVPPPLRPGDELARRTEFLLVQGNADARTALRRHAEAAGMLVAEDQSVDDLPYGLAAERLLARLDELRAEHRGRAVAVLTGGEVTVQLPSNAGVGGRNQQFALECARRIAGCPISVLSAGTDGVDGTAPAAGAVADGTTLARARALGLDVEDHLRRFDAHPLFDALGDSVTTGPTGQNVRDLRLLVHEASPRP